MGQKRQIETFFTMIDTSPVNLDICFQYFFLGSKRNKQSFFGISNTCYLLWLQYCRDCKLDNFLPDRIFSRYRGFSRLFIISNLNSIFFQYLIFFNKRSKLEIHKTNVKQIWDLGHCIFFFSTFMSKHNIN